MGKVLRESCLCGGVQYEVTGRPLRFGLDHCSRCRKSSGSAFAAWLFCKRPDFHWVAGEMLVRKYVAPVRETPPGYPRTFCGACGGPVPADAGEEIGIPAGTLDDYPGIRPQAHIFVEFKAPWYEITDSLPQFKRQVNG